jgi:thiol-disulfide isomerase/thioredoxin
VKFASYLLLAPVLAACGDRRVPPAEDRTADPPVTMGAPAPTKPPAATAPEVAGLSDPSTPSAWVKLWPEAGSLAWQIQAEVGRARARKLKPVAYGTATWCPPCQAIKKYRREARMADALRGTYVIELDVDHVTQEEARSLGYAFGVLPVFMGIGDDGRATGPKIDGGAWGENIPANMAPPLKAFFAKL